MRRELSIVDPAPAIFPGQPGDLPAFIAADGSTSEGDTVRIAAVGDIGFSGRVGATAAQHGFDYLLSEITPCLRSASIVFGNLEYPLVNGSKTDAMFAADPRAAGALQAAGFSILHLANNHVGEFGVIGLATTLDAVRTTGVLPLGAGWTNEDARALVRTDEKGVRIGWLGCGRTLLEQEGEGAKYWELDERELLASIATARRSVDILIVSIHIGLMYLDYPRPEHKTLAERLTAAGADIVLMHHAHVLQGVEVIRDAKVCCYNLGNFLLDTQEGNVIVPVMQKEQNETAVFVFDVGRHGVARAMALPAYMDDECRLRWAVGVRGRQILSRLQRISVDLEGDFTALFERQRAERNTGSTLRVLAFHVRRGNWKYVFGELSRCRPEHVRMLLRSASAALTAPVLRLSPANKRRQ